MRLWAISDLHLGHAHNRQALAAMPSFGGDWLIVAGDVGESLTHLAFAWRALTERFARVIWTPGNHELWSRPGETPPMRGTTRYRAFVHLCREFGVLTPEDPFAVWPHGAVPTTIAPIFVLYDYSFRPPGIDRSQALDWAREHDILCGDELLLHPDPFPTRDAWCHARCAITEERLAAVPADHDVVLVNHFPLRYDLAHLPRIPRFSIWCGTTKTEEWHRRFRATVVVSGHLHIRSTQFRDGVRFEEVSLGYPKQWNASRGIAGYLRAILEPEPSTRL